MDRALAVMAIAASVLAAAFAIIMGGLVWAVLSLLAVAAGVLAFVRRGTEGIAAGVVLVLAGLVATVIVLGDITFRGGGSIGETTSNYYGYAAAFTAALLVPATVAWFTRDDVDAWMPMAAGLAVVLAIVVAWLWAARLGEVAAWSNYVAALAALAAAIPAVGLLRIGAGTARSTRATS